MSYNDKEWNEWVAEERRKQGRPSSLGTVADVVDHKHGKVDPRPIHTIAVEIRNDWANVNYAAKPYLDAMHSLTDMNSKYWMDDARSIVTYFLSNAGSYRGDTARRIKAELKEMLKNG